MPARDPFAIPRRPIDWARLERDLGGPRHGGTRSTRNKFANRVLCVILGPETMDGAALWALDHLGGSYLASDVIRAIGAPQALDRARAMLDDPATPPEGRWGPLWLLCDHVAPRALPWIEAWLDSPLLDVQRGAGSALKDLVYHRLVPLSSVRLRRVLAKALRSEDDSARRSAKEAKMLLAWKRRQRRKRASR